MTYADDVVVDGSIDPVTEIRREQNYYPFGLEQMGNNVNHGVKNNLKTYQNQEFTEDLGLDTHEWRFRMSDPVIGRFWQVDPLAEDYSYQSPYSFSENDPVSGVELEGLEKLHVTVYNVVKNDSGGYTQSFSMASSMDNNDWEGNRYESQYNVYGDDNKTVTAIHTGPEAQASFSKSGIEITSVERRDLSAGEILEAASNNKKFQKAGETLENVGTAAGMVLSAGSMGGASLLVRVALGTDVVMGADDLTARATENGKTVMENTIGTDATSTIKAVVNTATATSGTFDAIGSLKAGKKANAASDAAGVVIDASSAKTNVQKVIEKEDEPQ